MSDNNVIKSLLQSQKSLNNSASELSDSAAGGLFAGASQPWSPSLVKFLSSSILLFSVLALVLCTVLLWRRNSDAPEILKIFGIISIISLSALLLIVGFDNEQLTPIVGLFGAIAGYLLGKDVK